MVLTNDRVVLPYRALKISEYILNTTYTFVSNTSIDSEVIIYAHILLIEKKKMLSL